VYPPQSVGSIVPLKGIDLNPRALNHGGIEGPLTFSVIDASHSSREVNKELLLALSFTPKTWQPLCPLLHLENNCFPPSFTPKTGSFCPLFHLEDNFFFASFTPKNWQFLHIISM